MEQWIISSGELKDFVEKHKLRNSNSIIRFNSSVIINTEKNNISKDNIIIMITFNNFNSSGELKFINDDLDPYLYPSSFKADLQQMRHIDNEYLLIEGEHKKNPKIGKYIIKVFPRQS
jgi:hypothetical protein